MKKILALIIVIAATQLADAQCTFTLSGKVIETQEKKPMEFAQLYIQELNRSAAADTLGYYAFNNLCEGTYTVRCQHFGCDSVVTRITITGHTKKNIYTEHHSVELGLIAVTAAKAREKSTQSSYELKGRELDQKKGVSLGEA